jgi:hypothetical protein
VSATLLHVSEGSESARTKHGRTFDGVSSASQTNAAGSRAVISTLADPFIDTCPGSPGVKWFEHPTTKDSTTVRECLELRRGAAQPTAESVASRRRPARRIAAPAATAPAVAPIAAEFEMPSRIRRTPARYSMTGQPRCNA